MAVTVTAEVLTDVKGVLKMCTRRQRAALRNK